MEFERVIKSWLMSTTVLLDIVAKSWLLSIRREFGHVVVSVEGLSFCREDCLGVYFVWSFLE